MMSHSGGGVVELPLVHEIQEARRRADVARDAQAHTQRLDVLLVTLRILARQQASRPDLPIDVPGQDLIDAIGARWEDLEDLTATRPPDVAGRLDQAERLAHYLRPLAQGAHAAATQLHHLQHEQADLLKDPRYAEVVAEIQRVARARDDLRSELDPLLGQFANVGPSLTVIDTFLRQLDWVTALAPERDALGVEGWRAASIAISLLETLRSCLDRAGFPIPVPADVALPAGPDPAESARLLGWVRELHAELRSLRHAVGEQADALKARIDDLSRQVAHQESVLLGWLG
jgi:hypothetical protein